METGNVSNSSSDTNSKTDLSTEESLKVLMFNTDSFFLVIMGIVVFLMQVGFSFLEAGAVRTKNTVNILIKTMVDGLIGALAYWSIGWALAYGPGSNGFIGESNFFSYNMDYSKYPMWFFQYVFAATAATIVSGSVAERCQFPAYIFYSFMITGCVYPPISHWVWNSESPGWLNALGFHDFAGSGAVHLTGGVCALVSCYIIGPRKGRFNEDGSVNEIPGHSVPLAGLGGGILLVCFLAFNGGAQMSVSKSGDAGVIGLAVVNTVIGGSTGGLFVLFFNKYILRNKWSYLTSLNGALTGMVCLCAGCNVYPIWASVIVAIFGGLAFMGLHHLMLRCHLDDPLDAVAVHCGGGSVGITLVHFFAYGDGIFWKGGTSEPWYLLGVNIAGGICIALWTAAWAFLIFYPLNYFNCLRIKPLTEFKGMDLSEHGEAAYPVEAWVELQYNQDGKKSSTPDFMLGSNCVEDFGWCQSFNLPEKIMPASAVIIKNSKVTFGFVPNPKLDSDISPTTTTMTPTTMTLTTPTPMTTLGNFNEGFDSSHL